MIVQFSEYVHVKNTELYTFKRIFVWHRNTLI